jgi:hypothetical protein
MQDDKKSTDALGRREIYLAARATIELFGNGAIAKTKERLAEVEAEDNEQSAAYWRALLEEVTRMHKLRHQF